MTAVQRNFGVLFVRAKEEPPGIIAVRAGIRSATPDQFFETRSVDEASQLIRGGWRGVVILILNSKETLIQVTKFLQAHYRLIKNEKIVRVAIFSSLNHSQVTSFLTRSGATEVIDFETPSRSISHKLSVHLKLVEKAQNQPRTVATEFDTVFKAKAPAPSPDVLYTESDSDLLARVAKSFEKKGASSTWNGIPVEIVDQSAKDEITIDVPKADWKIGEVFTFDFETKNIGLKPLMQLRGKIQELHSNENGEREMIKIQLDPQAAGDLEKIQEKIEALQDEILQFMTEAKG